LEPAEFVIFLEAREDVLVNDDPTITIVMEVHSRGCIDHTTFGDNMGAGITDATSLEWIDNSKPSTFIWTMDPDAATMSADDLAVNQGVEYEYEWNLCIETVEWTFTPKVKTDGSYKIDIEFDQRGDLPSFTATASITIAKTDVLGDIGFDCTISLWEDINDAGVPYNPNTVFQIGERFYSMIELDHLVVDTQTIEVTKYVVTQYPEEDDAQIDPIEDGVHDMYQDYLDNGPTGIYKFKQETTTLPNTAVIGADLDLDTFYLSVTGVKSVLEVDLLITYKQGEQEYRRLRRNLGSFGSWFEEAVGIEEDEVDYASMDREPDQQSLSTAFDIVGRGETMVGIMIRKMTSHPRYTGLFFFGVIMAGVLMHRWSESKKDGVYMHLVDEVEI